MLLSGAIRDSGAVLSDFATNVDHLNKVTSDSVKDLVGQSKLFKEETKKQQEEREKLYALKREQLKLQRLRVEIEEEMIKQSGGALDKKKLQAMTDDAIQKMIEENEKKFEENTKELAEKVAGADKTITNLTESLELAGKIGGEASIERQRQLSNQIDDAKKEKQENMQKLADATKANAQIQGTAKRFADINKAMATYPGAINDSITAYKKQGSIMARANDAVEKNIEKYSSLGAVLTAVAIAANALMKSLQAQISAGGGIIDEGFTGIVKNFGRVFTLGIQPEEMAKMAAENRQAINSVGGLSKALDETNPLFSELAARTGSTTEAQKILLKQMTQFASVGVKPSTEALKKYNDDIATLSATTGMSTEAATEFYQSVAGDADTINLLRKAREGEREQILANQRAMIQQNIALGMTTEQAREAAKMLNHMVAQKPIDRIKQAAKMQALGGALGVSGGAEAAAALRAGARATKEQKEQLAKYQNSLANAADQMRASGEGGEIVATQLVDKLGLDQQYGPNSPFSSTLGTQLAPGVELAKKQLEQNDVAKSETLQALNRIQQSIAGIMGNNVFGTLATAAIAIAGFVKFGKPLLQGTGKIMSKLGGKGGTGGAAGLAENEIAKTAEGEVVKGAEHAAVDAAGKVAVKGGAEAAAKTAGKGIGKSLLKKIPLIGLGAGILFGAQRLMEGDMLGAAGEVASGAAGTIPGVGTAASIGIDTALAGRDIYKASHPDTEEKKNEASDATNKQTDEIAMRQNEQTQLFSQQLAALNDQSMKFDKMIDLLSKSNDLAEKQIEAIGDPKQVPKIVADISQGGARYANVG